MYINSVRGDICIEKRVKSVLKYSEKRKIITELYFIIVFIWGTNDDLV